MITTMNTRLKQFLAAENISQAQFADIINVVRASVSHVLAGRNNPSYDFIKAIMDNYPDLNIEWLILGKGKMYKERGASAPVAEPIDVDDFSTGLLFPEPAEENTHAAPAASLPEDEIPLHTLGFQANFAPTNEINTTDNTTQPIIKQRKVSKIIVLFDDGSFQEM
jgi:transcriptional regulator with XRE-family HTH domain